MNTQVISRLPPYRPDDWVKLRKLPGHRLSERVVQIGQVVGSLTESDRYVVWRITFIGFRGEALEWHAVERKATTAEIEAALQRRHAAQR